MSKYIQAYFKNEDDAEGAKSSLLTMNVKQLEVGRLDGSIAAHSHNILHPLFPLSGSTITGENVIAAGYSGTTSSIGAIPVVARDVEDNGITDEEIAAESNAANNITGDDYDSLEYVLSAKVEDNEYDKIVHTLRNQGAYVEQAE